MPPIPHPPLAPNARHATPNSGAACRSLSTWENALRTAVDSPLAASNRGRSRPTPEPCGTHWQTQGICAKVWLDRMFVHVFRPSVRFHFQVVWYVEHPANSLRTYNQETRSVLGWIMTKASGLMATDSVRRPGAASKYSYFITRWYRLR